MSQEGANLPQEVEGSHDPAIAPHGTIRGIVVGLAAETAVTPDASNSSSASKLATSAVNSSGSFERVASPGLLCASEDTDDDVSKISSPPAVLHAGEDNKNNNNNAASSKIASPEVLLAGKENKAESSKLGSPVEAVLVTGEEKGNNAGGSKSKLATPTTMMLRDRDSSGKALASQNLVPHASMGNNNNPAFPNTAAVLHHASKNMENNAGRPKFSSPMIRVGEDIKARNTKLAVQAAVPHAGSSSSRLTRSSAAVQHIGKDDAGSKLAFQLVPRHRAYNKDNENAGAKAARLLAAAVEAGNSSREGNKSNVIGGERRRAFAAAGGVGRGRGKGKTAAEEDAEHELHIFTERERRKKMKNMFTTLHGFLPQLPEKADKSTIVGEAVSYIRTLEATVQRLEKLKLERQLQRALAASQQQQVAVGAGAGSSSRASSSRQQPAPASSSREATLADMVHGWESQAAQQATVAAANKTLAAAAATAAAAAAASGAGGSSSAAAPPPRGPVPFPAPPAGFQTWSGHNLVVSVANNEAYINLHSPRMPGAKALTKAVFVLQRHCIDVVTTTISAQDGFTMYGIHARVTLFSDQFPQNLSAEDRFKLAVSEILQLLSMV